MRISVCSLFLGILVLLAARIGDGNAVIRNFTGVLGQSVSLQCPRTQTIPVTRLYIHKETETNHVFINGFDVHRELPVDVQYKYRTSINRTDLSMEMKNISFPDEGLYRCVVFYSPTDKEEFIVHLKVLGVFGYEVKSVMEGESLTLYTNVTELDRYDGTIVWKFGDQEFTIAKINRESNQVSIYDDVLDGRLRDRLQVNNQTGDLTITNITTQHSGLYQIVTNSDKPLYRFNVTVYDSVSSCEKTEAVIRLVVSALVAVAAVSVLLF